MRLLLGLLLFFPKALGQNENTPEIDERAILLEFFEATGGPSWNLNYGWEDNDDDICSWYGVICKDELHPDDKEDDQHTVHTRHLQAPANSPAAASPNYSPASPHYSPAAPQVASPAAPSADAAPYEAPIPRVQVTYPAPVSTPSAHENHQLSPTVYAFPVTIPGKVVALYLKKNNLSGRTPPSLWSLPNLRSFIVSHNDIDIDFSTDPTGLPPALIELKMQSTTTSSLAGIGQFHMLQSLVLSGTSLGNVQIPNEILGLNELRRLHMAECALEGTLPGAFAFLNKLTDLNLYNNDLNGEIPTQMDSIKHLRILSLSRNQFDGTVPQFLESMNLLEELFLEHNRFTGTVPAFANSPKIHKLYLSDNHLTGNIPANFLQSLTPSAVQVRVDLNKNQLGRVVPATLSSLANINLKLTLAGNNYIGFEDASVCSTNWQDGLTKQYGCNAVVCPVGFSNQVGRRTRNSPCRRCNSAETMGVTTCLDHDDRTRLVEFFTETGGEHWHRSDNWNSVTVNYCNWYGITCFDEGNNRGRVRKVELSNNGLLGEISSTIYALDEMTILDVSHNRVVLPFEGIRTTASMFLINVAHTDTTAFDGINEANSFFRVLLADGLQIEGTLPREIYETTSLRVLSMANCGLTGSLETTIGQLTDLRELYLWGNQLRSQIPTQLGDLEQLNILSLAKNRFDGTLPRTLESLVQLQAFSVKDQTSKGGGLSGNLLKFAAQPQLTSLVMSGNKFEGLIPPDLLSSLPDDANPTVDLSSNVLTGVVPGELGRFDQMDLLVQDNLIDKIDDSLCAKEDWMSGGVREFGCDAILCPPFTYSSSTGRRIFASKDCSDCTDPNVRPILGQTSCGAKDVVLTERQILQLIYDTCNGKNWKNAEGWYTNSNICEWYGISCDDAQSVVSIVMGNNNMIGKIPTHIYSLPNLKILSVFANAVELDFDGIDRALNLEKLILDDTRISSVAGVGQGRSLKELNIRANHLGGQIPKEISHLVKMESLQLGENGFTGTIPVWLNKLQSLKILMLQDNRLTGSLLSFDTYQHIQKIELQYNLLTGSIPESFLQSAQRDDKIYVDLSGNMLTGLVPNDLAHLNRLSIRLHDNRLVGLSPNLCAMEGWNDYDVQQYGCNGIMCPKGSYSQLGRLSSENSECQDCPTNEYMGQTKCSSAGRLWVSGVVLVVGVAAFFL